MARAYQRASPTSKEDDDSRTVYRTSPRLIDFVAADASELLLKNLYILMADLFCKALVKRYVDEFVDHSTQLKLGKFTQRSIAKEMYPNRADYAAAIGLSGLLSEKGCRPLDGGTILLLLEICRSSLERQYRCAGYADPDVAVTSFEEGICKKLHLRGKRASLADFSSDLRFAGATSLAEFGLPDVLGWQDSNFLHCGNLSHAQTQSVPVIEGLAAQIARGMDVSNRLNILKAVVSGALLNYPGSRWHQRILDVAAEAAGHAQLLAICESATHDDAVRALAFDILLQLKWAHFIPTLDSRTNYIGYLMRGRRLPAGLWNDIEYRLDEVIAISSRRLQLQPNYQPAIEGRIGVVTMKSRILAALGNSSALREADRLAESTESDLERLSKPYGFLYPILGSFARGDAEFAITLTEEAVAAFEAVNDLNAAAAFGALQLQLIYRHSGRLSCDQRLHALSAAALGSPVVCFKHSHVFDVPLLRQLLRKEKAASKLCEDQIA